MKKIEIESQYQKIITENKMLNYQLVNIESTEKEKNREIKSEIDKLYVKIDEEKKINNELRIVI